MTRQFIHLLLLVLTLTLVPGCLTDTNRPEAETTPDQPSPTAAEDRELQDLLDAADARLAEAPVQEEVGDSALDHDHDHSNCDHDHSHDGADHAIEAGHKH